MSTREILAIFAIVVGLEGFYIVCGLSGLADQLRMATGALEDMVKATTHLDLTVQKLRADVSQAPPPGDRDFHTDAQDIPIRSHPEV
ncbi:MAG: hypothetical protein ACLQVL_08980 [Terriglobia bacterium]